MMMMMMMMVMMMMRRMMRRMMMVTATKLLSFWQQHAIPFRPKGNILHPVFGGLGWDGGFSQAISVMFLLCS